MSRGNSASKEKQRTRRKAARGQTSKQENARTCIDEWEREEIADKIGGARFCVDIDDAAFDFDPGTRSWRVTPSNLQRGLIVPDCHHPYVDKGAWRLLLKAARKIQPDTLILLGDWVDCHAVGNHPRTSPLKHTLEGELSAARFALQELTEACGNPTQKVFIEGNHETRLNRYIMQNAPELFGMLNIQTALGLEELGWEFIPYGKSFVYGKLHLTHDTGKSGMNAHRQAAAAHLSSTIIGHCIPINTEVLTESGFVKLADIQIGARVLSYANGRAEYVSVNDKVEWDYSGPMACFNNTVIAQRMTSEHHIYTKDGRYIPVQEALKICTKDDIVRHCEPLGGTGVPEVSDSWLRLIVAYAADGNHASAGSVRFGFKKQRKLDRLDALWRAVGGEIEWTPSSGAGVRKTLALDRATQLRLIELCPDKQLPVWFLNLSADQRQVVIDELPLWDGSIIRHQKQDAGIRQFCSYRKSEIDLVQLLLMQHGIRSRLWANGTVVGYDVLKANKPTDASRKLEEFVDWRETRERVGCISTKNQNFFIRTEIGSIELTSNTHRFAYEVTGTFNGPPFLACMLGWLGDAETAGSYVHETGSAAWAKGFGLSYRELDTGIVHVTPVPIIAGKCMVEGELLSVE